MTWTNTVLVTCDVPAGCTEAITVRDDGAPTFVVQELHALGWQWSRDDGQDRCPNHHRPPE